MRLSFIWNAGKPTGLFLNCHLSFEETNRQIHYLISLKHCQIF